MTTTTTFMFSYSSPDRNSCLGCPTRALVAVEIAIVEVRVSMTVQV